MVEKLLTNWVSICLYAFLRVRAPLPSRHSGAAASGLTDLRPHSAQGPRARGRGVGEGRLRTFARLDVKQRLLVLPAVHLRSVQRAAPPCPHRPPPPS